MTARSAPSRGALLRIALAMALLVAIAVPASAAPLDPNGTFIDDDGSEEAAARCYDELNIDSRVEAVGAKGV